jgi:hypothetical protein
MDAIFIDAKNALDVPKVAKQMPHLSILTIENEEAKDKSDAHAGPNSVHVEKN